VNHLFSALDAVKLMEADRGDAICLLEDAGDIGGVQMVYLRQI